MAKTHLTVFDWKDTDLMALVGEAGESGISAADLAAEMKFNSNDSHRAIGMRFAWMRRYGMLDYDPKYHLWSLTEGAHRVMEAQRVAAFTKVLKTVPKESVIEHMAHITSVYRLGDPMIAAMLRREFQYGTNPKSRVWNR